MIRVFELMSCARARKRERTRKIGFSALSLGVVSLLPFAFVSSQPSFAEDLNDPLAREIQQLGSGRRGSNSAEDRIAEKRAEDIVNSLDKTRQREEPSSLIDPRGKVVAHIRGTEGIPFLQSTEVVLEPVPTPSATDADRTPPDYWVSSVKPIYRIERCSESGTKVVERRAKGDPASFVFDRLYVSKDLTPLDSSEVYGINTSVFTYDGDEAAEVALRMQADKVPCVPYRIRFSDTLAYYHQGDDALSNFDKDPRGRGEIHTWIRRVMEKRGLNRQ